MAMESPFFLTKVECPVCKTINEFENIKVGAYIEEDHDTDFCPQGRQWRNPKYEVFNPLLFFMATCDNCFYTREFNQAFKDWKNDTAFRTYRQRSIQARHLEAVAVDGSVVKILGQARNAQTNPFGTAVTKFLLGIYDELLNEHPRKLDLGRFFLRIAWLYREYYGAVSRPADDVAHFAFDIEKAYAKLRQARDYFALNVNSISQLVDNSLGHQGSAAPLNSEFLTIQDGFKSHLRRISELQEQLNASMAGLAGAIENNMRQRIPTGSANTGSVAYGGFASFEEFLREVKVKWEYAPLNEQEALLFAVEFYKAALEDGHEIQPGNQEIQAMYLIAELSRRAGRNVEAKLYFNNTIKAGQQMIFENRGDQTRTALARKIVDLAVAQGKLNLEAARGE